MNMYTNLNIQNIILYYTHSYKHFYNTELYFVHYTLFLGDIIC